MSNFVMCTMCRKIFRKGSKPKDYRNHREYCNGIIFEIDELMIPAISVLLEKNYVTIYCCSGHCYNDPPSPYPYIMFVNDYLAPIGQPVGWYKEIKVNRNKYDGHIQTQVILRALKPLEGFRNIIEKQEYINCALNNLYKWINELEYNKNPGAEQLANMINEGRDAYMEINGTEIFISYGLNQYETIYVQYGDDVKYYLYKGQLYNILQLIENFAPALNYYLLLHRLKSKGIEPGGEITDDTIFNMDNGPISFAKKGE